MRNTLVTTWILASLLCFGRAQEPERKLTPAEVLAATEANLHGRAEAIYGSDLAAQRNALISGTPYERNRAIAATLQLPDPPRPPIVTGTVSAATLRHTVPKAASKSYKRGQKLAESGKLREASLELEKALVLDPDFADAHENLGALYVKLDRPAEAEPHLRRAIELNPSSSFAHSDLSAVQFLARDFEAAERSARRALELSRGNDWARFMLGLALVRNVATYGEGLRHLENASRSVPAAREALDALQAK